MQISGFVKRFISYSFLSSQVSNKAVTSSTFHFNQTDLHSNFKDVKYT